MGNKFEGVVKTSRAMRDSIFVAAKLVLSGEGTFTLSNGSTYKGTLKNNKFDGLGACTYPHGSVPGSVGQYKGEWMKDLQHGRGVFIQPNGTLTAAHV